MILLIFLVLEYSLCICMGRLKNSIFPQNAYTFPIKSIDNFEKFLHTNESSCFVGDKKLLLVSEKIPKGKKFENVDALFPWEISRTNNATGCRWFAPATIDVYVREGSPPVPSSRLYDRKETGRTYDKWGGMSVESKTGSEFYVLLDFNFVEGKDSGCSVQMWITGFYFSSDNIWVVVGVSIGIALLICCCPCLVLMIPICIILYFGSICGCIIGCFCFLGCCSAGRNDGGGIIREKQPLLRGNSINSGRRSSVSAPQPVDDSGFVDTDQGNTLKAIIVMVLCVLGFLTHLFPGWPFGLIFMLLAWVVSRETNGEKWVVIACICYLLGIIPFVGWGSLLGVIGGILML